MWSLMQLRETFKSWHWRDSAFPWKKNKNPLLQPSQHLLFIDRVDREQYGEVPSAFLFVLFVSRVFILKRGWGKAEIWESGSGRTFDLEWWAWKPNGCNIQCNFNWSEDLVAAHAQPAQVSEQLMSEICGMETKMFFQAPAGCSTITALLHHWPLGGINWTDFTALSFSALFFPWRFGVTLMKNVTMPSPAYGFNKTWSRRSLVAMKIYSWAHGDGIRRSQLRKCWL